MHTIKDLSEWVLWFPVQEILARLPWKLQYRLAGIIGSINFMLAGKRKKILLPELRKSLKDDDLSDLKLAGIIKESIILYWKDSCEILNYPKFGNHEAGKSLTHKVIPEIEGLSYLDVALERGGVVLLHLHFGPMQMVLPALGHRGYPVAQVGESRLNLLDNPHRSRSLLLRTVLEKQQTFEESLPAPFFYTGTSAAARTIVKWLKAGKIVDIAADGRRGKEWLLTRFLQRPAYFPAGPFRLASITKSTILPCFIIRQPADTLKLIIAPPLAPTETDKGLDPACQLQEFLGLAEHYVTMYPSHYCKRLWVMAREKPRLEHPLFVD